MSRFPADDRITDAAAAAVVANSDVNFLTNITHVCPPQTEYPSNRKQTENGFVQTFDLDLSHPVAAACWQYH
jgi:hypothetical protein